MNNQQSAKQQNNIFVGLVATGLGTILALLFAFGTTPTQPLAAAFCAGVATFGFVIAFWNFLDCWLSIP